MIEFRADFGAEDAVRLAPCKDDKPKDAEIMLFQAGSDCYLSASRKRIKKGWLQMDTDKTKIDTYGGMFGIGKPNTDYAKYFIGNSYLNPLTNPNETVFVANVTFEPGCRNNWHIHHASKGGGQLLLCVDGEGWYQEEGKPAQSLKAGDVIAIPAGVKHWHGAKANSWFSHLAVECPGEDTSNEWLEAVSDEEYKKL